MGLGIDWTATGGMPKQNLIPQCASRWLLLRCRMLSLGDGVILQEGNLISLSYFEGAIHRVAKGDINEMKMHVKNP